MRFNFTFGSVALPSPYLRDGCFATRAEVGALYQAKIQRSLNLAPNLAKHPEPGLGLRAEEKAALVAFRKTLTDEPSVTPISPVQQFSKTQ